tara:strand:- start:392 stop:526 length:135 start_codon:yes stop_codon:yes gene_type:complete
MSKRTISSFIEKTRTKRKGIHAKSKSSKNKSSVNYVKKYNRQGR